MLWVAALGASTAREDAVFDQRRRLKARGVESPGELQRLLETEHPEPVRQNNETEAAADAMCDEDSRLLARVYATVPTTAVGLLALLDLLLEQDWDRFNDPIDTAILSVRAAAARHASADVNELLFV